MIGSPPSRSHSPWIKDEREACLQGVKHSNFCCAVYRWQIVRGVHFLHEHPWRASSWDLDCLKAVRELPGVVVVRCDQHLFGLMERWHLKEGRWGERQSTQRTGWMTSINDHARELSEVQILDQSHELKTRVPLCLIVHATERYPPRLVEAILRSLSIHLRRKNCVHLHAVEVGIGPHVDHDVQVADFNETDNLHRSTMTNALGWNLTLLERRSTTIRVKLCWETESIRASTPDRSVSANGTEAFRDAVDWL